MNAENHGREDLLEVSHRIRSNFIRELVQDKCENAGASSIYLDKPPRRVVQFWNDIDGMPNDVKECTDSWNKLKEKGFELFLFNECQARKLIRNSLGKRYEKAFDKCYHPAMQSDYFRLCYIFTEGGLYVDTDDIYTGVELEPLFSDGRLKVQPLCYDMSTNEMVPVSVFTSPGAYSLNWIFYFNNNPLIATRRHPIIERALLNATASLERSSIRQLPEIQSTAGPGNLSKSIFDLACYENDFRNAMLVLYDWENIATTKWDLGYRNDERNWRLSNKKEYRRFTRLATVEEEG